MRRRLFPTIAVAALCAAMLVGCAAQLGPANRAMGPASVTKTRAPDPRLAESVTVLESLTDPAAPGCSAAVAVEGEIVWSDARGVADLATGEQLTTETRFDIASVSKQFTAAAVLMLERDGKLSVHDPVGTYIDGLPAWGGRITLDQLMHHTSHIPDYWIQLERWGYGFSTPASQADAMRAIAAVSRLDKGSGFRYSNSNYVLLASVVERVSGQSFAEFLQGRILRPLDLSAELGAGVQGPGIAVPYDDNIHVQVSGWAFYGPLGMLTTPTELARWADQYSDGAGEIVAGDFTVGAVSAGKIDTETEGRVYAAGIYLYPDGSLRHDGRVGGYISTLQVSGDRSTAIAVACNAHLANRLAIATQLWNIWVSPAPE